jgi:DUF4097 and DUF4098 domain-containing protein YvlB
MNRKLWILGLFCGALWAEKISVPLSDPSRPALVKAATINGSITVQTHTGKDVIVEVGGPSAVAEKAAPNGMRQILGGSSGMSVEEEGNVVKISTSAASRNSDLQIWVPVKASLNLRGVNGRGINVEGVEGDIDVDSVNGAVNLKDVSGTVVAHALNGKLTVSLKQVSRDKPMSFSTLNGTVDVTLPGDLAANVKVRNDWGKVYTDFEMAVTSESEVKREQSGEGKPRYRVQVEKTITGKINGGGPEITFRSMNGTIYIRKAGAR